MGRAPDQTRVFQGCSRPYLPRCCDPLWRAPFFSHSLGTTATRTGDPLYRPPRSANALYRQVVFSLRAIAHDTAVATHHSVIIRHAQIPFRVVHSPAGKLQGCGAVVRCAKIISLCTPSLSRRRTPMRLLGTILFVVATLAATGSAQDGTKKKTRQERAGEKKSSPNLKWPSNNGKRPSMPKMQSLWQNYTT